MTSTTTRLVLFLLVAAVFLGLMGTRSVLFSLDYREEHQPYASLQRNGNHGHTSNKLGVSSYNISHSQGSSLSASAVCTKISNALDLKSWPHIIYHKDIPPRISDKPPFPPHTHFDTAFFSSVEEDDAQGRRAVADFNRLRNAVLTPELLEKAGFSLGGSAASTGNNDRSTYAARTFARRYIQANGSEGSPLVVAVFGSSFTIGSNCGESSSQLLNECAWPHRLRRRWDEVVLGGMMNHTVGGPQIEWKMFQENAQGSVNIAQKIPALIDEFASHNIDVLLLDNTIIDIPIIDIPSQKPWFEAVVRALIQQCPNTLLVSIVDAMPEIVNDFANNKFAQMLQKVQQHYGMVRVDIANMMRVLHEDMKETQSKRASAISNILDDLLRDQTEPPPPSSYHEIDLLWPQTDAYMVSSTGSHVGNFETADVNKTGHKVVYWANFVPTTRKTKSAYYPANHPSWVTHQYVADSVLYALLRVVQMGLECSSSADLASIPALATPDSVPESTVAPKAEIESCFICISPITRIDAKTTKSIGNATALRSEQNQIKHSSSKASNMEEEGVIVTCGDFQWITDDRHRSGWQSDRHGSIARFRLKVKDNQPPTISITHMKSHATFGTLLVTLRLVTKKDLAFPHPLLGCKDVDGIINGVKKLDIPHDTSLIPTLSVSGQIEEFSRWDTVVFPSVLEPFDVPSEEPWMLLNRTVLGPLKELSGSGKEEDVVEYVDVYVVNPNENWMSQRIKIQTVTSC